MHHSRCEVIGTHYDKQAKSLKDEDALVETLERFRDEELEHRDIAKDHDGEQAMAIRLCAHHSGRVSGCHQISRAGLTQPFPSDRRSTGTHLAIADYERLIFILAQHVLLFLI